MHAADGGLAGRCVLKDEKTRIRLATAAPNDISQDHAEDVRRVAVELRALREQLSADARVRGILQPDALTLAEFAPRWLEEYAKANQQKPREIEGKESILRVHWLPRLGARPLNLITDADIESFKAYAASEGLKPKTVNNLLTVLNKLLKTALKWRVISRMPVAIEFLKTAEPGIEFYEFHQYDRLVEAAEYLDDLRIVAMILLGGDAGLRLGEIIALQWDDIDWKRWSITIQRSESKGKVTLPKGGRIRMVPMSKRLGGVLNGLFDKRRPGYPRVLYRDDSKTTASQQVLRTWISKAQVAAMLRPTAALHILRHTFCSHLAMRGAPVLAIKELAGHRSLKTTMRYTHLSPTEAKRAIGLVEDARRKEQRFVPLGISAAPSPSTDDPAGIRTRAFIEGQEQAASEELAVQPQRTAKSRKKKSRRASKAKALKEALKVLVSILEDDE